MKNQEFEKIILSAGVCEDDDMHKKALLQIKEDNFIDDFDVTVSTVDASYIAMYANTINGLVKVYNKDILAQDYLFVIKPDTVQLCWRVVVENEQRIKCSAVKNFKGPNAIQNAIKYMCGDFIESTYRESLIDLAYKSGKFPGMQPSESDDDEFDEFDDYDDIMI